MCYPRSMIRTKILGLGSYVPDRVVTNDELTYLDAKHVRQATVQTETNDAWIQQRTGISERRYVPNDGSTSTSDLALQAANRALADAGLEAKDIDCIILGTLSPDFHFPGTAVLLQKKLGIAEKTNCACFDIRQQCSAFVYGLQMADAFVRTGMYKRILLIGAELHSHSLDFYDARPRRDGAVRRRCGRDDPRPLARPTTRGAASSTRRRTPMATVRWISISRSSRSRRCRISTTTRRIARPTRRCIRTWMVSACS